MAVREQTIFHGSKKEGALLNAAVAHNCGCVFEDNGAKKIECVLHRALLSEQRFLDGLAFARRIRARLLQEEWR